MRAPGTRGGVPSRGGGRPHSLSHDGCIEAYFHQARLRWVAGALTRRDRVMLDLLRADLGLSILEASDIESRAARDVATPDELRERGASRST